MAGNENTLIVFCGGDGKSADNLCDVQTFNVFCWRKVDQVVGTQREGGSVGFFDRF